MKKFAETGPLDQHIVFNHLRNPGRHGDPTEIKFKNLESFLLAMQYLNNPGAMKFKYLQAKLTAVALTVVVKREREKNERLTAEKKQLLIECKRERAHVGQAQARARCVQGYNGRLHRDNEQLRTGVFVTIVKLRHLNPNRSEADDRLRREIQNHIRDRGFTEFVGDREVFAKGMQEVAEDEIRTYRTGGQTTLFDKFCFKK